MAFSGTVLAIDHREMNAGLARRPNPASEASIMGHLGPEMDPPKMTQKTNKKQILYIIYMFFVYIGGSPTPRRTRQRLRACRGGQKRAQLCIAMRNHAQNVHDSA